VRLGETLEEVGDSAVETLKASPDQAVTWFGGLETLWTAADGGMESSIGYLSQLYHLSELLSGEDAEDPPGPPSTTRSRSTRTRWTRCSRPVGSTRRAPMPPLGSGTLADLYRAGLRRSTCNS
jgi:hypothetical protein